MPPLSTSGTPAGQLTYLSFRRLSRSTGRQVVTVSAAKDNIPFQVSQLEPRAHPLLDESDAANPCSSKIPLSKMHT